MKEIENIQLEFLHIDDAVELQKAISISYSNIPDLHWEKSQIQALLDKFADGQVVIKIDGELAAAALSIVVEYDRFSHYHTYSEITGEYTFNTHSNDGDTLYGIDIFVKPKFRGLRLGR